MQIIDVWMVENNIDRNDSSLFLELIEKFLMNIPGFGDNLNFERLGLTSLPNIFMYEPIVSRLKILDLSDNQLDSLPESIGCLTNVNFIELSYNAFTHIPTF